MYIEALFIIGQNYKIPNCSLAIEWINQLWYTHTHTHIGILNSNENEYTIAIGKVNIKNIYIEIALIWSSKRSLIKVLCLWMFISVIILEGEVRERKLCKSQDSGCSWRNGMGLWSGKSKEEDGGF